VKQTRNQIVLLEISYISLNFRHSVWFLLWKCKFQNSGSELLYNTYFNGSSDDPCSFKVKYNIQLMELPGKSNKFKLVFEKCPSQNCHFNCESLLSDRRLDFSFLQPYFRFPHSRKWVFPWHKEAKRNFILTLHL
jgi:hypothetical protein